MDLERYLPAEERATALWLAGSLAAVGALGAASGTLAARFLPLPTALGVAITQSVVLQALPVLLVAVLARWPLRGPAALTGFLLVSTAIGFVETALRFAFAGIGGALIPTHGAAAQGLRVATVGPPLLGGAVTAVALVLVALALAPAGTKALGPRILAGCGLGPESEPTPRRLALFFAFAGGAQWLVWFLFTRPLAIADALTNPPSTAIATLLGAIGAVVFVASVYVVLYVALRRYRAPRSLWLAFLIPLVATAFGWVLPLVTLDSTAVKGAALSATIVVFVGALAAGEYFGTTPKRHRRRPPRSGVTHPREVTHG